MRIMKGAVLGAFAVVALASSASAQSPTLIVTAEKVQKGPVAMASRAVPTQSIRELKLQDEEMTISLTAQNVTACQMQMPNGGWTGVTLTNNSYTSYPIGPSGINVKGKIVNDVNGLYPKSGETKVVRFMCVGASGSAVRDSVRISR